jgi:hypothetical protein
MQWKPRILNIMMLAGGLATLTAASGCYTHHRYYESSGGEVWVSTEQPYYERWETETHREHREYNQRRSDEQHDYWQWRRDHHDNDRRDNDHRDNDHR